MIMDKNKIEIPAKYSATFLSLRDSLDTFLKQFKFVLIDGVGYEDHLSWSAHFFVWKNNDVLIYLELQEPYSDFALYVSKRNNTTEQELLKRKPLKECFGLSNYFAIENIKVNNDFIKETNLEKKAECFLELAKNYMMKGNLHRILMGKFWHNYNFNYRDLADGATKIEDERKKLHDSLLKQS